MKIYVKKVKNTKGKITESLWIRFTHQGKLHRKPLGLPNTKANMKLAQNEILPSMQVKLLNGALFEKSIPTVDEAINISFSLQSGNRSKAVQYDYVLKYNKHIKDVFGDIRIDKIKSNDITLWQNSLRDDKGLAVKTVKQIRGLLYTMFEDMIIEEIIDKNPVKLARKLTDRREIIEDIYPFSKEEIEKILTVDDLEDKNMFAFLFFTGVRGGEALALKWKEVDFRSGTIHINLNVRKGEFGSPKWGSIRTVPIIDALLPYLKSQFELTGDKNSFVFLNTQNENYWDISKIRESKWKKNLLRVGVKYRPIHKTRSTFISTLISNGEDVNYVSKIVGHKTVRMTLEKYSKYIPHNHVDFGKCFN
ncbi:MAG: tyrosine-type recombinase/integrase [Campylobacterota bacterium]|nr:tyrosine-type recombinase/integrase [Campylobacterota bacterium]